jgi:hypothetical protein
MRIILAVIAFLIGVLSAAVFMGASAWNIETAAAVAKLEAGAPAPPGHDAAPLPPPVERYLRRALHGTDVTVRSAIATQEASFFLNNAWRPLTATQHFATARPGFVWDARIAMTPPIPPFYVRDAYVGGHGSMKASMVGLHTLVDQSNRPELDAGALQRFLGEAVWFPTALRPSAALTWTPRDDRSAVATLTDGETRVSLRFEFNGDGDVVRIVGDRYREDAGRYRLEPWVITCGEHAERGGMRIPLSCEAAWAGTERLTPYWRGRIVDIDYTLVR